MGRTRGHTAPGPTSAKPPVFVIWLPRVLTVLALLMLVQIVVPIGSWPEQTLNFLWTWVIPAPPVDFVTSVVLVILAAALSIRKRVAWWILVIIVGLILILNGLVALLLALVETRLVTWDMAAGAGVPILTLICLIVYRGWYTAKTQPRGLRKAVAVFVLGILATFVIILSIQAFNGGLTMVHVREILAELLGFRTYTESSWMLSVFGFGSGGAIIAAFWTVLRSQGQAEHIDIGQERAIRQGLADHADDSLGYFSTRRDRSVLFAGDCALTYRVEQEVCLVAGDPIGPHAQWPSAARAFVAHAESFGWVPAVLAASRHGAQAFHEAGLQVLHVGDEAVVHTPDFSLASVPEVQRMVAKLTGLGYTVRIRRQTEIPAAELTDLRILADDWRDGATERGFSMALGRMGDPADGDCIFVEALFPTDHDTHTAAVAGLLTFVPWGQSGASLDVMRRHPDADNGVTELMVASLIGAASGLGISRISLNFAVFRTAFEQGKELGAGPVARFWRNVLLFASRFWQLESLYRSNEQYRPEWVPRMLCYPDGSDLARIGLAVSVAEGFLTPPRLFRSHTAEQPIYTPEQAEPLLGIIAAPTGPNRDTRVPDQMRHRLRVRSQMLAAGVEPYPAEAAADSRPQAQQTTTADTEAADPSAASSATIIVEGRVLGLRDHGGVVFADLQTDGTDRQLLCERDRIDAESYARLRRWVSLGDRIRVWATAGHSRTGTPALLVAGWEMTAKSLRPWPGRFRGVSDPETKVRRRYLDLAVNTGARDLMVARSQAFQAVRESLQARDFLEVETPILQTVHGGANARPFLTHINAYDLDLYLRIAPELFLKRLLVGGFDRVFEIGRNFRNEGVDATHNPEFSMLEAYQAGGDYSTMRALTRTLIINAAEAALGTTRVRGKVDGVVHEIDLAEPWQTISLTETVSHHLGEEVTTATSVETLRTWAGQAGIHVDPHTGWGTLLQEMYEALAESTTIAPTFFTDFPTETSPLTRQHRRDPLLAEKWDLIIFGSELATAYSELVDPVIQRQRLTAQSLAAARGDAEAMELDEDFLLALEHGMPPAGGMGMGLDRLIMLLTGQNIRQTIAFPLAKPKGY